MSDIYRKICSIFIIQKLRLKSTKNALSLKQTAILALVGKDSRTW